MTEIAPLCPLRYAADDLANVVAPPYDVIDEAERAVLLQRSPHNVVRLILPEGSDEEKHRRAGELLLAWQRTGVLQRDERPAFYRYEQTFTPPVGSGSGTRTRVGFLALVRLTPFGEGSVRPHERTLAGPKADRLKLFRATRANLSPGFMLYADPQRELDPMLRQSETMASFRSDDGVSHLLGRIADPLVIAAISARLGSRSLLIADGHHRYETALRYAGEVDALERSDAPYAKAPEHRYFMVYLCNAEDEGLLVCATHRLVHSLPHFDWQTFLDASARDFVVQPLPGGLAALSQWTAELGSADRSGISFVAVSPAKNTRAPQAVRLTLRPEIDLSIHPALASRPDVLRRNPIAVLHSLLLEAVLGISLAQQEQKTHVTYLQDPVRALAALGRGEGQVLFLTSPTAVREVQAVADAGEVMPQKSTFFYPKVLTGLALHTLDPHRSVCIPGQGGSG